MNDLKVFLNKKQSPFKRLELRYIICDIWWIINKIIIVPPDNIRLLISKLFSFMRLVLLAVHASYDNAPQYNTFGYAAAKFTGQCPPGWDLYHSSCYYFSRDRLSWWQASVIHNHFCRHMHSKGKTVSLYQITFHYKNDNHLASLI